MLEDLDSAIARADSLAPAEVEIKGSRFAVISDIHANLEALNAVLADIRQKGITEIVHLGDLVGYGPEPQACIELSRQFTANIAGNHDVGIYVKEVPEANMLARLSWEWTRTQIGQGGESFLKALPFKLRVRYQGRVFEAYHASPVPEKIFTDYLFPRRGKDPALFGAVESLCLVGHTHVPLVLIPTGVMEPEHDTVLDLTTPEKKIINPGSVGQPRDGNRKASYLVVDGGHISYQRVGYDVRETQRKMLERGVANIGASRCWTHLLADRLWLGR